MRVNAKELLELVKFMNNFVATVKLNPTDDKLYSHAISPSKAAYIYYEIPYYDEPMTICFDITKELINALKAFGDTDIEINTHRNKYVFTDGELKFKTPIIHPETVEEPKLAIKEFKYKVGAAIPLKIWKLILNEQFINLILEDGKLKFITESVEYSVDTEVIPEEKIDVVIQSQFFELLPSPSFTIEFEKTDYPISVWCGKAYLLIAPVIRNEDY